MMRYHCIFIRLYYWSTGVVKLADSSSYAYQGRVEICVNDTWGIVCDDGFDSNDARGVCHSGLGSHNCGHHEDIRGVLEVKEGHCFN